MTPPALPLDNAKSPGRPRYHFTPAANWMNDPNGLVFHGGRYHLYYQHNPLGPEHANMSWGHATSSDLLTWTEHPVAILYDDDAEIYSGSIVVDHENSSGFGAAENAPLVAIYTAARRDGRGQAQALAFSRDGGFTWEKYANNPVLDRGTTDFRDPKVIRYVGGQESYWVMVAVEAKDQQVLFYRSDDLKTWTFLSSYGPAGAIDGVWECPDLFPLALDGDPDDIRWVLLVSLYPGGIAGGSGTQYFVGEFDGHRFEPDEQCSEPESTPQSREELERYDWLDWGRDCYAGVTFSGLPDEERVLIAWMSNWDYAREVPTTPWRGAMTLPRRLSLVSDGDRPRLRQTPVGPSSTSAHIVEAIEVDDVLGILFPVATAARIDLEVLLGAAEGFELRLHHGEEGVVIRYRRKESRLEIDRRHAGAFHPDFPTVQTAPLDARDHPRLSIWLDATSLEIFAAEGLLTITDQIYTPLESGRGSLVGLGGEVVVERLVITDLDAQQMT